MEGAFDMLTWFFQNVHLFLVNLFAFLRLSVVKPLKKALKNNKHNGSCMQPAWVFYKTI